MSTMYLVDEIIKNGYSITDLPSYLLKELDNRCIDLEKELSSTKYPSKMALVYKKRYLSGKPTSFKVLPISFYSTLYEPDSINYQTIVKSFLQCQ